MECTFIRVQKWLCVRARQILVDVDKILSEQLITGSYRNSTAQFTHNFNVVARIYTHS